MMTISRFALMAGISVALLSGCTGDDRPQLSGQPNVELIQDMMDQPALKAQDYDPHDPSVPSVRLPPENTVTTDFKPYKYHNDPAGAAAALKNPVAGQMSPEILKLGRQKYEIYCGVCHGMEGKGDGTVAPKMALKPPPVVSEKVTAWKDAQIYHVITDGQGVMSSYLQQIPEERDRWAIVNYVRSLQRLTQGQ